MFYPKTFVALDLETTSLEPRTGAIIEIGAVRFRGGEEIERFTTFVNPQQKIPFLVSDITGITDADVADAPLISAVMPELVAFIGGAPIVGHNIGFDLSFLAANGFVLESSVFDTWRLATMAFPGFSSYSLENIAQRLHLRVESAHRACDDARVAGELFYAATEALVATTSRVDLLNVATFLRSRDWSLKEVFETLLENYPEEEKNIVSKKKIQKKHSTQTTFSDISSFFDALHKKNNTFHLKQEQIRLVETLSDAPHNDAFRVFEVVPDTGRVLSIATAAFWSAQQHSQRVLCVFPRSRFQRQDFLEDYALLSDTFADVPASVLKSPRSYLCRDALETQLRRQDLEDQEIDVVVKVLLWQSHTRTGDLDELSVLREQRLQLQEMTQEDCDVVHPDCFAAQARLRAEQAHVLFTDHATLLRWLSHSSLYDSFPTVFIDAAEEFGDATSFILTETLTQSRVMGLLERIAKPHPARALLTRMLPFVEATPLRDALQSHEAAIAEMVDATSLFFGIVGVALRKYGTHDTNNPFATTLALDESFYNEQEGKKVRAAATHYLKRMRLLLQSLKELQEKLESDDALLDFARELQSLLRRLHETHDAISEICINEDPQWVNWVVLQRERELILKKAPLRVAPFLQEQVYTGHHVVLLSSGISEEGKLSYYKTLLGIPVTSVEQFGKQDHAASTAFFVVGAGASASDRTQVAVTSKIIADVLSQTSQNALLVTPSYTASRTYYESLKDVLAQAGYDVFAQGVSGGRQKILEKLVAKEHSLLIGSSRFFQSIEVPAQRMPLVFLLKLPFPYLGEPLEKARELLYENSFRDFMLPQAIACLRKVVSATFTDGPEKKALVLLDPRFARAPYRHAVLASLPTMHVQEVSGVHPAPDITEWFLHPVDNE